MGEVYLAEDTTLDRRVALKVLPASFAADATRRDRFIREAKSVAALNHPNIVTLHSVEDAGDVLFLTMEFVAGQTLAEAIARGGMALDRFFAIAIPLAGALAAAHQRGIVHRDFKPSNVMLAEDGRVKVLDFGIARAIAEDGSRGELATHVMTHAGIVLGTPAYMAPEQAEGKVADARSDIFSLGIVLFEMLTGRRPFDGATGRAAAAHLPALKDLRPDVPRELARLVNRCLAAEPGERYQSALDIRHALEEIRQDLESGELAPARHDVPRRRPRRTALLLVAGAAAVAIAAGAWLSSRSSPTSTPAVPRLLNAVQLTSSLDVESYPTWSPDGDRVAYMGSDAGYYFIGDHDIWVAQVGSGEPVNLTNHPANDRLPSWSPDGNVIAFFSNRDGAWAVYTMPAIGGAARNVLPLPGLPIQPRSWSAPQWSADGKQLFVSAPVADQNVVFVLSLESLQSSQIHLPRHGGSFAWDLRLSPDGQRFAYIEGIGGSTEVTRLWSVAVAGGEPVPITEGRTNVWSPSWSNDGRIVYYVSNRGGSMDLWQQEIASDGTPLGEAVAVTQGLGIRSAAFSRDGSKLAYGRGARITNVWRTPLLADRPATWADAEPLTSERAYIEFIDISPDGKTLALSSDRRGNPDLWLLRPGSSDMTPLATDPTPDWDPKWSPDGEQILFYAYRSGNRDIWIMPARGGPARQLTTDPGQDRFPTWSPDGRHFAYMAAGSRQAMIMSVESGEARPLEGVTGGNLTWSAASDRLLVVRQGRIFRIDTGRPAPQPLPPFPATPYIVRALPDGRSILYSVITGPAEERQIWRGSLADGKASRVTQLAGRRGDLSENFATDGKYLYFIWREDDGDIWTMDVSR